MEKTYQLGQQYQAQKLPGLEPLLTESEAAKILGVSIAWLQRERWKGTGPAYIRHGRAIRYAPADLRRWIADNRHEPASNKERV